MSVAIIGIQVDGEILTAAATSPSASFHNLFHKAGSFFTDACKPGKVSYSFNNWQKSGSYSKVTQLPAL
jgi:hypothetical protein